LPDSDANVFMFTVVMIAGVWRIGQNKKMLELPSLAVMHVYVYGSYDSWSLED